MPSVNQLKFRKQPNRRDKAPIALPCSRARHGNSMAPWPHLVVARTIHKCCTSAASLLLAPTLWDDEPTRTPALAHQQRYGGPGALALPQASWTRHMGAHPRDIQNEGTCSRANSRKKAFGAASAARAHTMHWTCPLQWQPTHTQHRRTAHLSPRSLLQLPPLPPTSSLHAHPDGPHHNHSNLLPPPPDPIPDQMTL